MITLKKTRTFIMGTDGGDWVVKQGLNGPIVFRSQWRNGLGTRQCRRWISRKLNGFNFGS